MKKAVLAAVLFLITPAFAGAETMYITDRIEASVCSGKGLSAGSKLLEVVRTGTKVDVLGAEGDYVTVRLENGTEGWLHARYLTAAPPLDFETIKEKYTNTLAELNTLKQEKAELETLQAQQAQKIQETEAAFEELKAGCTDFIKIRTDLEKAEQEVAAHKETVAQLKRENENLAQNAKLMWFIFGAAAVLAGFLIGMWLQGLRSRRRPKISF